MQFIGFLVSIFLILSLTNYLITKFNFFLDKKKSSPHKIFIDKNTNPPFSGGILILLSLLILIPNNEINFKVIIFLVFTTGFLSDMNILKSANIRFLFQIILVIFSIFILDNNIQSLRLETLDILLNNLYFKLFFTSFCILVLINGTNFIDGLNTIVCGYYLLILFFIQNFFEGSNTFILNHMTIVFFITILVSILILNALNLLYLGDNGAYLLSFIIGIILINLSNNLESMSPYYVATLLWYPAYENLFSIIRKIKSNKSALKPDNLHLHQLIFLYIKDKLNYDPKIVNTFSGLIINLFNLCIFAIATHYYTNTKIQISLFLFSVLIYNFLYLVLSKNKVR